MLTQRSTVGEHYIMSKANIIRERIDRSRRKGINGVLVFSDIVRPRYRFRALAQLIFRFLEHCIRFDKKAS